MKNKILLPSLLILSSRAIDLYTTQLGVKNFQMEEQNFLVNFFDLNFFQFCIIDILLAFILIIIYFYSFKNSEIFKIRTDSFYSYVKLFLYKKDKLLNLDFFNISFKRSLILFGSIIPKYIFLTSCVFSLNNFWVYLYLENNKYPVLIYNFLSTLYFFDFIIFILPVFVLIYLSYKKLQYQFHSYNV